ncbi:hypothetical protein ElyMa_002787700 [Elysia marginata]|uniref:Uncharacterized protein n=1 Tax=Elysia marginata TaxID=1093978 RepID=A0AAV4HRL5_9GAST|nr:hypothetical protein ElyMa_002787700 [Elysia marginata]
MERNLPTTLLSHLTEEQQQSKHTCFTACRGRVDHLLTPEWLARRECVYCVVPSNQYVHLPTTEPAAVQCMQGLNPRPPGLTAECLPLDRSPEFSRLSWGFLFSIRDLFRKALNFNWISLTVGPT